MVKRQISSGGAVKHNPLWQIKNFCNYTVEIIFDFVDHSKRNKQTWGSNKTEIKLFFEVIFQMFYHIWLIK